MNMAVIVFWSSTVAIAVIGLGVLWNMAQALLVDNDRK